MDTYTIEYASLNTPPVRERRVQADGYAVNGDFVDFTTVDGKKVLSLRVDAVVIITRDIPPSP
ncbi:hypothetical protein ACFWPQ_45900 [Streptomyces sp. NPDC058464]|uniref:hypothetical protein n=1 Tax=Streptomyces sp. NPDC058464 TaxID=3346511 RepID=UPI00366823C5